MELSLLQGCLRGCEEVPGSRVSRLGRGRPSPWTLGHCSSGMGLSSSVGVTLSGAYRVGVRQGPTQCSLPWRDVFVSGRCVCCGLQLCVQSSCWARDDSSHTSPPGLSEPFVGAGAGPLRFLAPALGFAPCWQL